MAKYNVKKYELVLFILLVALSSVLTFYATQLLMQIIVNYEALTIVSLAPIPMLMITASVLTFIMFIYRVRIKNCNSPYHKRLYSIIIGSFSLIGMGFAIFAGLGIYKTFIGEAIFVAYPLITLIVNTLFFGWSIFSIISASQKIDEEKAEKPVYEHKHFHRFATAGYVAFLYFALSRFGGLLLLPMLVSPVNGVYAIPLYIWMLMPMAMLADLLLYRDFLTEEKRRPFAVGCNLSILFISIICFVIIAVVSKYHQSEVLGSVSNILFLERLVTFPIDFIFLSITTILLPAISLIRLFVIKITSKK